MEASPPENNLRRDLPPQYEVLERAASLRNESPKEVPLLFPSLEVPSSAHSCCAGVFVVDDENATIYNASTGTRNTEANNAVDSRGNFDQFGVDKFFLRGMASISSIITSHNKRATITTSASVDAPRMLNVAFLLDDDDQEMSSSSRLLRLDWSMSTQFGSIVSVQAFASLMVHQVDLCVVDSNGLIAVISIDVDTWEPAHGTPLRIINVQSLLASQWPESSSIMTTFELTQERVTFLDKNRILLATNPFLMAVHVLENKVAVWSLQQGRTASNTSSSSSTISSLFTGIFIGSSGSGAQSLFPDAQNPVDMNPILSLCTADNDYTTVFTFHSGGMLRKWRCPGGSCLVPDSVQDIPLEDLPSEEDWSDEPLRLVAHSYDSGGVPLSGDDDDNETSDSLFCAALFIQTTRSPMMFQQNAASSPGASFFDSNDGENGRVPTGAENENDMYVTPFGGSRLIVSAASGSLPDNFVSVSHAVRLPDGPSALVGAAFMGNVPSLTALIAKDDATALVRYEAIEGTSSGQEGGHILKVVPTMDIQYGSLDDVAGQELWCIEYFPSFSANMSVHELDVLYSHYLFRPKACRGLGHVLPPSASRIRMALQKCIPQYRVGVTSSNMNDVALEVIKAMHEWRTSRSAAQRGPIMQLVPANVQTPGKGVGFTPKSFYESLQKPQEPEWTGVSEPQTPTNMNEEGNDRDATILERQEYEEQWQQLLVHIWNEEAVDRIPLAFAPEKGIILRSGSVSALLANPVKPSLSGNLLDRVAAHILEKIATQGDLASQLYAQEQRIMLAFSNCTMDMTPTAAAVASELSLLTEGIRDAVMSQNEIDHLQRSLNSSSVEDWVFNVQQVNWGSLGASMSQQDKEEIEMEPSSSRFMSVQERLTAASLCARRLDEVKQLFLGRYLVLCGLYAPVAIRESAWLGYLRTGSLLVASCHHVPCLSQPRGVATTDTEQDGLPPKKRPSFDSMQSESILLSAGMGNVTTMLDCFLANVNQGFVQDNENEFTNLPAYSRVLYQRVETALFRLFDSVSPTGVEQDPLSQELSFMLPSVSKGAHMEQPKLVLTLLSPFLLASLSNQETSTRREVLETTAECLLVLASNYPEVTASIMEDRAYDILCFDAHNLEDSYRRMNKLRQHVVARSRLVTSIGEAIPSLQEQYSMEFLSGSTEYKKLLSLLFYKSLEANDWGKALIACKYNPNRLQRRDHLQRLVTAMVDSGALCRLVSMCSLYGEDTEEVDNARGMDLYSVAVDILGKAGHRDWYTHLASGSDSISDYQGALYALHLSRNELRKAAQAMELRYVNATSALALDSTKLLSSSNGLPMDSATVFKRTRLILDDLVLAAAGAHESLCLVEDPESQFIISGEYEKLSLVPFTVSNADEASGIIKRPRDGVDNQDEERSEEEKEATGENLYEYRLDRYNDCQDLRTRLIVATGVRRLWIDDVFDQKLVQLLLSERDENGTGIQLLIMELLKAGHYDQGLILTLQMKESLPGSDLFLTALSCFLCDHLVPLTLGVRGGSTPSLSQILAAYDAVGESSKPPVLLGPSPRRDEDPQAASIRVASIALLESATKTYTTAETPFAARVADCLVVDHRVAALPEWLVSLLKYGSFPCHWTPGLFARRPQKGFVGYLGDPCALLNIYMMAGMYHFAFELVSSVLDSAEAAPNSPAMRLPEKGDMDFVPYETIDLLYNLVDAAIENGDISDNEFREVVLSARDRMVQSLQDHFDRMEMSEEGIKSARILASS